MNIAEFDVVQAELDVDRHEMLDKKGASYAGNNDRLANFKRIAERLGADPIKIWAVYFMKHIDAILQYVKDGTESPEGVYGNFIDAMNYLDLGNAILKEKASGYSV
jgi:hypothetical protein